MSGIPNGIRILNGQIVKDWPGGKERTDRLFSHSQGQLIEALLDLVKFSEQMPGYEQHPLTEKARQATRGANA